ncbi:MAG: hypothetical protein QMB16_07735 [Paracoccaceae bacterium]|jgi:hypothetical protein
MIDWFKRHKIKKLQKVIWQNQMAAEFLIIHFQNASKEPDFLENLKRIQGQSKTLMIFDEKIMDLPPEAVIEWSKDNKFLRKVFGATIFGKLKTFDEHFIEM